MMPLRSLAIGARRLVRATASVSLSRRVEAASALATTAPDESAAGGLAVVTGAVERESTARLRASWRRRPYQLDAVSSRPGIRCGMLLTREEMTFDFGGASSTVATCASGCSTSSSTARSPASRSVTGCTTRPISRRRSSSRGQSLEEMQHVDNFLRIMTMLGCQPKPAHPAVRFLATGMMGGSWAEHVALEMAQGEGFVLQAFYAVIDTLDHKPSVDILRRAVKQEERHVEFGEQQTAKAIEGKRVAAPPPARAVAGVDVGRAPARAATWRSGCPPITSVLRHLPAFLEHANTLRRAPAAPDRRARSPARRALGRASARCSSPKRTAASCSAGSARSSRLPLRLLPWFKKKRVTDTYLRDPHVTGYQLPAPDRPHSCKQYDG